MLKKVTTSIGTEISTAFSKFMYGLLAYKDTKWVKKENGIRNIILRKTDKSVRPGLDKRVINRVLENMTISSAISRLNEGQDGKTCSRDVAS